VGLKIRDGQQVMLDAREIKSQDEIMLLNTAASMVDAVYHMIYEELKPGVRESDIVARATKMLFELGSDDVEAINAVAGERCSPHPHNFTDRIMRPGDQAFFDVIQAYMGYRTCYYRTINVGVANPAQKDAYKRAREWIDASIDKVRPGVGTDEVAAVWPKAQELGFSSEMDASGCSSVTASAWRCTSARSSAAWSRWRAPPRSRKAWCSRSRPTARRKTAIRPRASRKKWS
jgi:Xaa-Pro aminopeptidase